MGERLAVGVHAADDDRGIRRGVFDLPQLVWGSDRLTLDRAQPVAGLESGRRRGRVWHDPGDLARIVVELRKAKPGEQDHRDQEIGRRASHEDQDPLPGRLAVETVRVLEVAGLHAAHPDVADHRDRPNGVKRAAAGRRPDPGPGPDGELDHPHLEELGQRKVAGFVGCDQQQEHSRDRDDYQEGVHVAVRLPSFP